MSTPLKLTVRHRLQAALHESLQRFQEFPVHVDCHGEVWALGSTEMHSIIQAITNCSLPDMPSQVRSRRGTTVMIQKSLARNNQSLFSWYVQLTIASY